MEALAEQVVAIYLTRGGKVFIVPNYSIPPAPESKSEWSCPDFVALDFEKREVVVVEVGTGNNVNPMLDKVADREKQWFQPLRAKLEADGVAEGWSIRFLGFVRRSKVEGAKRRFAQAPDVTFMAIEDATFSWDYWTGREGGLPR